ncbi:hypothetical protein WOLCODRAFT_159913 [Wolfiporia cocos MD-104 SS10]|uniref:Uncharacterized protein n=1 Tax=Wolfiporia cocos (strain MD-104) TaxID=742152 RepID=A0A2H3ITA2_WOLCO|nr:hypothetical protein WOLCODRAFT_159913 [Wolfiporia cocos MD-104 SS10]
MPPKVVHKASISQKDAAATAAAKAAQSAAMPPPPDPAPPQGILEPELNALMTCFRNTIVKTGQVYRFHADARRLGISKHAPHPPRTLTASLGREVEKYDQLCDAMEAHLQRAIAILQRDLSREEERLKAEAAAAAASKVPSPILTSAHPFTTSPPISPTLSTVPGSSTSVDTSATASTNKVLRRQSTVSLSSLQRPPFPHKLDLSSSALRTVPDEPLPSGLSSPVTLAPKSSHRNSFPQELVMAALNEATSHPVDIDLTVGDTEMDMEHAAGATGVALDPSLGASADKPIELDLDMDMDIFSEGVANAATNTSAHGEYFNQPSRQNASGSQAGGSSQNIKPKVEEDIFLHALNAQGDSGNIFASLEATSLQSGPSGDAGHMHAPSQNPQNHPSPSSFLASLGTPSQSGDLSAQHGETDMFSLNFGDHAGDGMGGPDMHNLFGMGQEQTDNKPNNAS